MSEHLLRHGGTRSTPQSEPIRPDQVENDAGGYVWQADRWSRLRRFLILGTEGGTFYASERDHTIESVAVVRDCVAEDGLRAVAVIVDVSSRGLAPSNDPALYALAACLSLGDTATKRAAGTSLPLVARTATHLYHFVAYMETMRGWGRMARKAVQGWYEQAPERLSLHAVKYRQRDGWSHRDLLRLSHPRRSEETSALFDWIAHRDPVKLEVGSTETLLHDSRLRLVEGFEAAQLSTSPEQTARLVRDYDLPREALLPEHLADPVVWRALLESGMPIGALVRNLANMTRHGVLAGGYLDVVRWRLADADEIRASRMHPMALLVALRTYASGHGVRGGNEWAPIPDVVDALDEAFYLAFDNVEPTGKRILLGVDVSGSMGHAGVAGSPLTAREAAVAMALVTLHAEPNVEVVGFTNRAYDAIGLSRRQRLDDALRAVPTTGEGTDCSVPIRHAARVSGLAPEAIVLYTDNQTWSGDVHVSQAMTEYRRGNVADARLVACGLVANEFTACDPNDPLSLNVAGFDASTPALISEFAAGRV